MSQPDYEADLNNYFWLADEVDKHETPQALALGKLVLEKWGPKSCIDIGCSSGIYLVPYKEAGLDYLGIDGASGVGKWCRPNFEVVDLRQPWTPSRKFDLALCIETGEHVPFSAHDNLVKIITESAPLCFFSAAPPGQGGEGHVAEAEKSHWIGVFDKFGFIMDAGLTDSLAEVINIDPVYDHCHWLRFNSMVFRKA